MRREAFDKCGVFGIVSGDSHVASTIYDGLLSLQHRGQESCGMATFDGSELRVHRAMGLVSEVFDEKVLQYLLGKRGIGHIRYSTTGSSTIENAQPFYYRAARMALAVGLNGNITNYELLRAELEARGHVLSSTTDTEVIAHLLGNELDKTSDLAKALKGVMQKLEGAYSLIILTGKGHVVGVRDPLGFRPLCMGRRGGDFIIASESAALDAIGANFEREVKPGEVVILGDKARARQLIASPKTAHCMFEWVYFARPDSVIGGRLVGEVRERLGRALGQLYPLKVDLVVPIPDSGRSAAFGYSLATGVKFGEALIKNRYVWRTFIMPSQTKRANSVRLKLNPVKQMIQGKKVAVVDDSLVRGTTLRKIARLLRDAGAAEVHILLSCPPIVSPCYMGVNFPTYQELAAHNKSIEQIRQELGVESLNYMTVEKLVEAIGLPKQSLCLACLTGDYPVKIHSPSRV
ncbi:MAG: amidophosphoribosyltransferase [Candidatus Micrarchaeia archaeon]